MSVWQQVIGQHDAVGRLLEAARDGRAEVVGPAMTHSWLFTGPPGSGRSVAARAFAAALQCTAASTAAEAGDQPGCGHCTACHTAMEGTHADVHRVVPEGLSIGVDDMRALVQTAARRPSTGRWQVVLIEDADRLTEGASNALLKAVEEPPARTVFLLCAPSDHHEDVSVTIRSRCRLVALSTPGPEAIAEVLVSRDGIDGELATWAAGVCGGHVGRARRLATDPDSRARRDAVLDLPARLRDLGDVFRFAEELVGTAETEAKQSAQQRDAAELEELRTAMGAGGTGKGTAAASRGSKAAERELERRQKSRATRIRRDALDRALVDLACYYRDVLVAGAGASARLYQADRRREITDRAASARPERVLAKLEAVLQCRRQLEDNVKPRVAVEGLAAALLTV